MASLRKKLALDPAPDTQSAGPTEPVTVAASDPVPAPPPLPSRSAAAAVPPLDDSQHALRKQLADLQQAEAIAAGEARRQQWLSQSELAQRNQELLDPVHRDVIASSDVIDTSPQYFQAMEAELARRESQRHQAAAASRMAEEIQMREPPDRPEPKPASRGPLVSAPVSRESYGSGGYGQGSSRIKLNPQQAEMARLAGITQEEYGRQLQRLNQMKASGDYYSERR